METRFGKCPRGSYASYQLSFTESNFQVFIDISSVARTNANEGRVASAQFPKFPIYDADEFQYLNPVGESEKKLLEHLTVDKDKVNDIEVKTRAQSESEEWKNERKFRFTACNFGLIINRKRNHDSLVSTVLHPKPFSSRYTAHGKAYEPVALQKYQKYMYSTRKPVTVCKSGLVVCMASPFLGASPDGKVIDIGCREPYGLVEVKCPETKFRVSPLDACSDPGFFLEVVDEKPKLKRNHNYYGRSFTIKCWTSTPPSGG